MRLGHRFGDEIYSALFDQFAHYPPYEQLVLLDVVVQLLLKHIIEHKFGDSVFL